MALTSLVIHTNYDGVRIQYICSCLSECQLVETRCLPSQIDSSIEIKQREKIDRGRQTASYF